MGELRKIQLGRIALGEQKIKVKELLTVRGHALAIRKEDWIRNLERRPKLAPFS